MQWREEGSSTGAEKPVAFNFCTFEVLRTNPKPAGLFIFILLLSFICNFILDILTFISYYNVNIFITYCFSYFFMTNV